MLCGVENGTNGAEVDVGSIFVDVKRHTPFFGIGGNML